MKLKKKAILYLEGMLNKEESDSFIDNIENRPDIHDFIKEYRWLESGLKDHINHKKKYERNEKKEKNLDDLVNSDIKKYLNHYRTKDHRREEEFLLKLNQTLQSRKNKPSKSIGFILNLAASLALIAVLIAGLIHVIHNNKSQEFNTNLFAEYFTPWNDNYVQEYNSPFVSIEKNSMSLTAKGENLNKDLINSILRSDRMKKDDILRIAILLIKENETSMAESYLTDIIETSDGKLVESARYYLSLLYIRNGATEQSVQNLEILCKENNIYTRQSCKLLGTLEKKNLD